MVARRPAAADRRDESVVDGSCQPGGEVAMAFLIRRPGSAVWLDHLQAEVDQQRGVVAHVGFGVANLDAAEVLGADESVLAGTNQADVRAVFGLEGLAVEVVGDDHVLSEHVLEQRDRSIAIEALEDDVGDRGARADRGRDERAVEVGERDASPAQPGGGPPGHTVEVGHDLTVRQGRQVGEGHRRGRPHRTGDLDAGLLGHLGRWLVQVGAEAGEAVDPVLAGRERHPALRARMARRGSLHVASKDPYGSVWIDRSVSHRSGPYAPVWTTQVGMAVARTPRTAWI